MRSHSEGLETRTSTYLFWGHNSTHNRWLGANQEMISEPEGRVCQMSYGRKEGDIGGTERRQDDITPKSHFFLAYTEKLEDFLSQPKSAHAIKLKNWCFREFSDSC